MKNHSIRRMTLALLLSLALLAGLMPAGLAEGEIAAVVKASSAKVYAVAKPHACIGALRKGTEVVVERYSGSVAQVRYKGQTGLMAVKDLQKAAAAQEAPAQTAAPTKSVVVVRDARAYAKPSTSASSTVVKAGTTLTLLSVSGSVAKVQRGGVIAYMALDSLGEPGSAIQTAEIAPAAPAAPVQETITWNKAVVTKRSTRIYRKASTSSAYWIVDKGVALTLVISKGNVAQVSRGGVTGYMALSDLEDAPAQVPAAQPETAVVTPPAPAQTTSSEFTGGSNKDIIYRFLINRMGYNKAAAVGVLSNIKYESNYKTDDLSDNGTSYGITQWHAGRLTRLISWCESNGLDYTTLEGQLWYLKYDLEHNYTKVHNYLKNVEDSPQGAYDAAYYFCYNFEVPSNRASRSDTRGKYARDTLYNS